MTGGSSIGLGFWVSHGFQMSSKSSVFPRSAIGLAIVLHLAGPFASSKAGLSDMRMYNVTFQLI